MRTKLLPIAVAGLILAAAPLWAHHSFAAEFDYKKVVNLQGTVKHMEWVNPHTVIHVAVKNPDGAVTEWMIEGNTPNSLLRAGLTKKSLEPGTEVVVQGYRARSGDNIASGRSITMKSGQKLSLGSEGDAHHYEVRGGAAPLLNWVSSDEELWKRQLELARGK